MRTRFHSTGLELLPARRVTAEPAFAPDFRKPCVTELSKTDLAADRTDMAEDRTLLANERTFAGWMRTGMASVGIALGFHALFNAMVPAWVPRAISTTFLIVALFIFWAAERRAARVCRRLDATTIETFGGTNFKLVAGALTIATGALIAAIWLLRID